jgi:hypothetical protein
MQDNFKYREYGSYNANSFIESKQVAWLLSIHLRNAQYMLQDLRKELGRSKNAGITVEDLCKKEDLPIDEVLKALKYMPF